LRRPFATAASGSTTRISPGPKASEAIVPPEDLSLDELRELLEGEGLIPDLPTA